MLDINGTTGGLVKIISNLVGYRLSTTRSSSGTVPSVAQERSGQPKPAFPYITVDHININPVGYSQSRNFLDEQENEVDEFDYIGSFRIKVNGGVADDALGICEEVRSRFLTTKGKRQLYEHLPNSGLLSFSDILFFPTRLSTDFEEAATITIRLWMRSIYTDETTDVIETVEVDGELYTDLEQNNSPLTTKTVAP